MNPSIVMIFFYIAFIVLWAGMSAAVIFRDLRGFKTGFRAVFRLYITDFWAIALGLLPSLWLISRVISERGSNNLRGTIVVVVASLLVLISQCIGLIRACIHVAPENVSAQPSRIKRMLWLGFGAIYGLAIPFLAWAIPAVIIFIILR